MLQTEHIQETYKKFKQDQVFKFLHKLNEKEKSVLYQQLSEVSLEKVQKLLHNFGNGKLENSKNSIIKPWNLVTKRSEITEEQKNEWLNLGYNELANGTVAILLLAGGQGTRLGAEFPKGMFDVGLPSRKTLFQIQAERIIKLQHLTESRSGKTSIRVPWYIMTSFATEEYTRKFFEENRYFGLDTDQVHFFSQGEFPCLTQDGKIILEAQGHIASAPNGNGGVWSALQQTGTLTHMISKNIRWISSYCVDNILVKIADPYFIGFCVAHNIDCASKVVAKSYPEEPVGVLSIKNDRPCVIEYSEIDEEMRKAVDENGTLLYNWSHIVLNNFSIDFVKKIVERHLEDLPFHIANKKIPFCDDSGKTIKPDQNNALKAELFIFDVFPYAENMRALEVDRSEEFSPLKNHEAIGKDCPLTCRRDVSSLHKRYIKRSGGSFENDDGLCEISPLLSYDGEGLETLVRGKTFKLPLHLDVEGLL